MAANPADPANAADPAGAPTATGAPEPRSRVRWTMAAWLLLPVTFVMSLDRTAMTVAAPAVQKAHDFSLTEMSVILTAFAWAYALFQVTGGWLAQRFGPRRTLALAGVWWSVFTFVTPYGSVFLVFVVLRILLGLGQAADWPSSVLTLGRWFPKSEQSRGNSLLLAGLYAGNFIGTPLVAWIVASLGWAWPFHIFAVAGFLLAVTWWWYVRDEPRQHPRASAAEIAHIEYGREDGGSGGAGESGERLSWRAFIRSVQFWAVGLEYAFLLLIQGFFVTWLPTYLVQARGISLTGMGMWGSLPWAAMIIAVFGSSVVCDRLRLTWRIRVRAAITCYFLAAGLLIGGALVPGTVATMALLSLALGAVGVVQVQVWAACQDLGGQYAGTVSGWTNLCGNLTGAAGPLFTGLLVGIGGNWALALIVMAVAGILGAVCWLFVHPERPLQAPAHAAAH